MDAHIVRLRHIKCVFFPVEKVSFITLLESSVSCDVTPTFVEELIPLKNRIQLHTFEPPNNPHLIVCVTEA